LAPLPGGNSFIHSEHVGHNVVDAHDGDDHNGVGAHDGDDHNGVDAHDGDDHREGDAHADLSDADGDDGVSSTSKGNNRLTTPHKPPRCHTGQGSHPVDLAERIDGVERRLKPLLEPPRKRLARTNARVHELHMQVADLNKKVNEAVERWKSNLSLVVEDIKAAREQERHDHERCTEYANRDRQVQWRSINRLHDQLEKQIDDVRGALDAETRGRSRAVDGLSEKLSAFAGDMSHEVGGRMAGDDETANALQVLQIDFEQERADHAQGDADLRAQIAACQQDLVAESAERSNEDQGHRRALQTLEGNIRSRLLPMVNNLRLGLDSTNNELAAMQETLHVMRDSLSDRVNADEIHVAVRHGVTIVKTYMEEFKAEIIVDFYQAVNALNGRVDSTNNELAAAQESLHAVQNLWSNCVTEVAVGRGDLQDAKEQLRNFKNLNIANTNRIAALCNAVQQSSTFTSRNPIHQRSHV